MKEREKVAIVACSNGLAETQKAKIEYLKETLMGIGQIPILSKYIYAKQTVFSGTGKERAESLMNFYRDEEIKEIYDVSGGDLANEVLSYLDYKVIENSGKRFWGYSDLTTIINAIYTKTGKHSVLYQVRNLVGSDREGQMERFNTDKLFDFSYEFIQGTEMEGIVIGGNIRCLLKLSGTEYWPDMTGKILLLEAMGGTPAQMTTYLNQLKQMGVFDKINGILLGTFTKMEQENLQPAIIELVKGCVSHKITIAKTNEIGHGPDSRAIRIGANIKMTKH